MRKLKRTAGMPVFASIVALEFGYRSLGLCRQRFRKTNLQGLFKGFLPMGPFVHSQLRHSQIVKRFGIQWLLFCALSQQLDGISKLQGTLQCDAYVAYGSFVKKHERNIPLAGCWAHVRRNFYEAREQAPQRCGWILRQIGHLYRIEDTLRRNGAGPRKRAAVRASQSRPICQRLHRALVLFKKSPRYLPRSAFGQASTTPSPTGRYLASISKMAESKLTKIWWKTLFGLPLSEKRTGCFSAMPMPAMQRHPLHCCRELPLPRHRSPRLPTRRAHQAPLDDQLAG